LHQMAGFDHDRFRRERLPPGFEPGTMIAIGYPDAPDAAPPPSADSRVRSPLNEFVFGRLWGEPAPALAAPLAVR